MITTGSRSSVTVRATTYNLYLSSPKADEPTEKVVTAREVTEEGVRLAVVKPNLVMSADRKWGFTTSSGATVSASISDGRFLDALPSLSFSLGTVMVVNLRKTQVLDRRLNIYIDRNDSYVITDVLGVERPPTTP